MSLARCAIDVRGLVQGVGFRPFVHGLARRFELGGFVYNGAGGVHIEVEGEQAAIDGFLNQLRTVPPLPAKIASIACHADSPRGDREFLIEPSRGRSAGPVVVPPDVASCDACQRELWDPWNRRHLHPFINCTECGPRATIVTGMPYDRERTTMEAFPMCVDCRREYEDPTDRRFHAQPIACPGCGPVLRLVEPTGGDRRTGDPVAGFAEVLRRGKIGAIKGIGGFHLVCDATNDVVVEELRHRKHRDRKPFAVMVADTAAASRLAVVDEAARHALLSAARPVVLLRARLGTSLSLLVAPGVATIGILLPYAPVHHLLLERLAGRPLVMTSGNVSDEPIVATDETAFASLGGIADAFLTHDRPIHLAVEDSVVRSVAGEVVPIRRSRGYAPLPIDLGFDVGPPTLALGGHLKAVFAFGVERAAVLGPHFGDLHGVEAYFAWSRAIDHFERLLRVRPTRLVHDLHPDYASTRYAEERFANDAGVELVAVQHHHAHLASCMAEHRLDGDVIGVCFDGMGYGDDGTAWGGEFLVGGFSGYARFAHLSEMALPGGDTGARQPWRVALAALALAGESPQTVHLDRRVDSGRLRTTTRLIEGASCPKTTSMGRLFDAIASLLGVLDVASYEGEAAMRLEALAESVPRGGAYPVELVGGAPLVVDTRPLIHEIVADLGRGVPRAVMARRFHSAIVEVVVAVCERIRQKRGLHRVVLSGGVFANAVLSREIPERLAAEGFHVFQHRVVPPNDGGLCLGQLAIAAQGGGSVRRSHVNGSG